MASQLSGLIPSAVALTPAALAALAFTRMRPGRQSSGLRAAALALAIATLVQTVHFAEETATGLHERLPALFGLPAIPLTVFVTFNLAWILLWGLSVAGLRSSRSWALFSAWFLAIAGVMNGVVHPLLSLAVGGYFPGLLTSPLIGIAALWLFLRLKAATGP